MACACTAERTYNRKAYATKTSHGGRSCNGTRRALPCGCGFAVAWPLLIAQARDAADGEHTRSQVRTGICKHVARADRPTRSWGVRGT